MKKIMLGLVRFYQLAISPHFKPRCKFIPSCSWYTLEAIETYGAGKGFWLGLKRLLRCNPFSRGGYDPVP
jgi:hypothetical protein